MLFLGRSTLVAALERVLLAIAICWLIGTSVLLTRPEQRWRSC
jgi:hypothetical protein